MNLRLFRQTESSLEGPGKGFPVWLIQSGILFLSGHAKWSSSEQELLKCIFELLSLVLSSKTDLKT